MVQMPSGVPVATMVIGKAGAIKAAVLAAEMLSIAGDKIYSRLVEFKKIGCKLPK